MKVLVTGVKGQLGYDVVNELTKRGIEAVGVDIQDMDITDAASVEKVIGEVAPDAVIHCAAYTAVDAAEDNVELCRRVNADGTQNIANVCKKLDCKMIYISTDYVFDGTAHTPYTEDCNPCPDSVYGTTKLEGEKEVMNHCEQAVVIRTAWLYSIFGNNFVKTMLRLGKERDSLGVVFDQIGTPTYANDLARAIYAIINKGIVRGIYHFSNEGVCSWYDFTVAIHRLAGITTCKVKPLHTAEYPAKANRPAYSVLDKTKIKTTFDIEIPHWEESLKQCLIKLGMKNEE